MRSYYIFLLFLISIGLMSKDAMAFGCDGGTTNIPVTVKSPRLPDDMVLIDMNAHSFTCTGVTGVANQDAIRIEPGTAKLHSLLVEGGYEGFFVNSLKKKFSFTDSGEECIWPDALCTVSEGTLKQKLPLIIGMTKVKEGGRVRLPAGTEIVKFQGRQRGRYSSTSSPYWGSNTYWFTFVLQNDFIMPAFSCNVSNSDNIVVKLPPVDRKVMQDKVGRYDGVSTPFDINLTCDPETRVDVTFSGEIMAGHPDVLKNSSNLTSSVGIQVLKDQVPIVIGDKNRVIESAKENETLNYRAYYYYNGGDLSPGTVKSLATVTFDYR